LMNGSRALPCQKALNRSSMSAQTLSGPRRCLTASRSGAILLTVLGVPTRDRVAERRAATRQEIVSAAWALAEEHGLHGFTLRDLATRVGMRAPSLYSHVDSKLALYDAMYEDAWLDFEQRAEARLADLGEGPREAVLAIAMNFAEYAVASLPRHQLMNHRSVPGFVPSDRAYAPAVRTLERAIAELAARGVTDRDDVDIWLAVLGGLVDQQHANDPGGRRYLDLVPRAVHQWADAVGLPPTRAGGDRT
jgi:AcrR family transcriptional regulator